MQLKDSVGGVPTFSDSKDFALCLSIIATKFLTRLNVFRKSSIKSNPMNEFELAHTNTLSNMARGKPKPNKTPLGSGDLTSDIVNSLDCKTSCKILHALVSCSFSRILDCDALLTF